MAKPKLSDAQLERLRQAFASCDPNGDGFIGEYDFVLAQVTEKENGTADSLAARVR